MSYQGTFENTLNKPVDEKIAAKEREFKTHSEVDEANLAYVEVARTEDNCR
jgi:hypothetical protein